MSSGTRSRGRLVAALLCFAIAAVAAVLGVHHLWQWAAGNTPSPSGAQAALVSSIGPTPTSSAAQCPNTGPAKLEQGPNHELVTGGLPADNIDAAKQKLLDAATTNPVFVSGYAFERGIRGYIDANTLVKDGCWTPEGYKLSLEVIGIIKSGTAQYGNADPGRRNSGSQDGKLVVSETAGLNGDLKSVRIYYPDGSFTEVLVRCSNFLFEGDVPEIPRGKTDNPPTPTGQTPQPPNPQQPECPPGTVGTPPNCVAPKNSAQQPENRGNIPPQVQPGGQKQTASPTHAQPVEPPNPPPTYNSPAPPAPPAPSPRPTPPPVNQGPPSQTPAPPGDPCVTNPSSPICG
ncbi:MAG TPA: hypothetical protein VD907_01340 [Verrucomicrobiae bacterium]|nr:hypothetical protein [Verrucomicrobiae bacterium]